jgi:Electron transfer DM13
MNNKKKGIIGFLALLLLVSGGFGLWYKSRLDDSKLKALDIPSRLIPNTSSSSSSNNGVNMSDPNSETENMNSLTSVRSPVLLKSGSFVTLDPLHYASGEVKIFNDNGKIIVELQDNFKTNPDGPDLFLWLVKKQNLGGAVGGVNTDSSQYINLGKLNKTSGKQQYSITQQELDSNNYAVVIWCQAFNVQFSNAVLN